MAGILLDTHCWIWLRAGRLDAKPEAVAEIRSAAESDNWFITDFTLFEIAHATNRKRLRFDQPLADWFRAALTYPGPQVLPLSPEVASATMNLPSNFHGDPGDRILAATAITHGLTICTHDKTLLRFAKQGLFQAVNVNEKKEKNAR